MTRAKARTRRSEYPDLVTDWLEFGGRLFKRIDGTENLGRFGLHNNGALTVEATVLYSFVNGLAGVHQDFDLSACSLDDQHCRDDARAAFRYCLRTHVSHPEPVPGAPRWGEDDLALRLVDQLAVTARALCDVLTDEDREALDAVIEHEADANRRLPWLLEHVDHGFYRKHPPVPTERFGRSYADSNAWRANVLARALLRNPNHEHADAWQESLLMYLANVFSVPADAVDETIYDGRPIAEWHAGANLHPSFALEQDGFFHPAGVNSALQSLINTWLVYDEAGVEPPELLFRHVPEVWDVQRRLLLWDGRIAYPAGENYPRNLWDQMHLLPILVFMDYYTGDDLAREAEARLVDLIRHEHELCEEGAFCASRLREWHERIDGPVPPPREEAALYDRSLVDPAYYLTLAWWLDREAIPDMQAISSPEIGSRIGEPFVEAECGLAFQRNEHRFASWSWRANGSFVQGLVLPAGGDDLAEWEGNLVSRYYCRGTSDDRRVLEHQEWSFEGGIATCGRIAACDDAIEQHLNFVALPDGRTAVLCTHGRAVQDVELLMLEGLHLNLANDIYNGNMRTLRYHDGEQRIRGVGAQREELTMHSPWVNVDDTLGVVALDGNDRFSVLIDGHRRATCSSLCYDVIMHPLVRTPRFVEKNNTIEESTVALIAGSDARDTARWPARHIGPARRERGALAFTVRGRDDIWYLVAACCSHTPTEIALPLTMEASGYQIVVGDPDRFMLGGVDALIRLDPCTMIVAALAADER